MKKMPEMLKNPRLRKNARASRSRAEANVTTPEITKPTTDTIVTA